MRQKKKLTPWAWVPTLYFAEGLPYVIVMTLSVIMYKRLGISNSDIALYTSWLYLPWVIKPFWSPLVDLLKTKRYWIITMQLVIGAGLAGVAFTIPTTSFFQYTLAFLWLLAFSSATHDIAADGFYMLGLNTGEQAFYVGIRGTFYRLAMLTGQGLLVILAGMVEANTGSEPFYIQVNTISENTYIANLPEVPINTAVGYFVNETVDIGLQQLESAEAERIISLAKENNIKNGFYSEDKIIAKSNSEKGFWENYISAPLTNFLKKNFSTQTIVSENNTSPNIGVSVIKLNSPPAKGDEIVLNLSRNEGDKNIAIVEGTRFQFTESNWQQPAYVVFQIDGKLKTNVTATFIGRSGNIVLAWTVAFFIIAFVFVLFFVYHKFVLPYPTTDKPAISENKLGFWKDFTHTFISFFKKDRIGVTLAFLLLYRLGESQLVKLASPFLLDSADAGGLGLTTGDIGLVYGTIGIIGLSLGGILGGILVARNGLTYWLLPMVFAMNLPNLVYVYLAYSMPSSIFIITSCVAVEQFGYGFGFTAYMMYTIYIAQGQNQTAHYAIATGFMALGMMLPGMISGWLQDIIGYKYFFVWVVICTIPGFILIPFLKFSKNFGKKEEVSKEL